LKRKVYYVVPLLLLLLGLLGPAVYSNKVNKDNTPTAVAVMDTDDSAASGETAAGAGNVNHDQSGTPVQPSSEINKGTADSNATGQEKGQAVAGLTPVPDPPPNTAGSASADKEVTVKVAVLGKNGELLFGPASVTITKKDAMGVTALDALDATGLPYYISAKWPDFVESVAGQSNKGQSGWMFKVNEEIPLVASDDRPVTNGDKVIWWYSRSMDIPPPEWDDLLKR